MRTLRINRVFRFNKKEKKNETQQKRSQKGINI